MSDLIERLRYKYADLLHQEAADEIERLTEQLLGVDSIHLEAEIKRLRADMKDIEILSDRLEAPKYVKQIHALAKAALKGVDDE